MHVVSFINVINNILIENNPKNYVDFQGVQSLGSSYFGNLTQRKGQTDPLNADGTTHTMLEFRAQVRKV